MVVSIVDRTWTIEECGDRDPSGARVGAILQALIAREPVEQRPIIRGWLPPGFVPPQITIVSARPSTDVMSGRSSQARENNYGFPGRKCCIGGATSSNAVNLRALRAETVKGVGDLEREAAAGAVPIDID